MYCDPSVKSKFVFPITSVSSGYPGSKLYISNSSGNLPVLSFSNKSSIVLSEVISFFTM